MNASLPQSNRPSAANSTVLSGGKNRELRSFGKRWAGMTLGGSRSLGLSLTLVVSLVLTAWIGIRLLTQANRIESAGRRLNSIVTHIELRDFARVPEAVRGLSEHPRIVEQLRKGGNASGLVDELLLQARLAAKAAIIILIDPDGIVRGCSAESDPSLVGQSYGFRPYFKQAMAGNAVVYGAVGVTTGRRGFYFSMPVGDKSHPVGVAVAKLDLAVLDAALAQILEPVLIESDEHVVFATNQSGWLYHTTVPTLPRTRERLQESRQFANVALAPLAFDLRQPTVTMNGSDYSVVRVPFEAVPGFSVVVFDPVRAYPLSPWQLKFVVGSGLVMSLLGALVVALLWSNHRRDLARERLVETEENLSSTLAGLADAVMTTDCDGIVTHVNPEAVQLTGLEPKDAIGKPLCELLGRNSPLPVTNESPWGANSAYGESKVVSRNGEQRRIVERVISLRSRTHSPVGAVHVFRDVSEEAMLREQLQQAQKMEAIGRLAGGVAHDFNNLLTAISGNAELANARLGEHKVSPFLREIVSAATRASELTRQLLTFSRKAALRSVPLDIHAVIREAISLFDRGLHPNIAVSTELDAKHCMLIGDSTQLQGAVLNLLINARDAMQNGGHLHVSTQNRSQQTGVGGPTGPKHGIEITIRDNGIGIPESIRGRIFEPFFTTKDEGHGTGLGLAAVYGCVQVHGGSIAVDSAEGEGSTFRIWLPITDQTPQFEEPVTRTPAPTGGHLILADDDARVRGFAEDALRLLGYEVTSCGSGVEAIALCEQLGQSVRGCIFDIKMPGPVGAELLAAARAIRPGVPVLFVSGCVDEQIDELLNEPLQAFLAKPYRLSELGDALEQLLASH